VTYRERLWPAVWMYLATALLIPGSLLVFVPISPIAGVISAVVLFGAAVLGMILWSPVLEVRDGVFRAGAARIPVEHVGTPEVFRGADATAARGVDLDARAWLCLRGWVDPVVRVPITDPRDPAPYWLVSTRRPDELVAALEAAR
jgi:Protein of unknown function (DUF3093)